MANQVTLAYSVQAQGPNSPVALLAQVQAVVLPTSDASQLFGATLASDNSGLAGDTVTRTIVFNFPAAYKKNFPDGSDQAAPWRDLYTHILGEALKSLVTAAAPVLA